MSTVIEDSCGNILTESTAVLNQWTQYCRGLYDCELHQDTSLHHSNRNPTQEAESLLVLKEQVEEAVLSLKAEKSPGVGNIFSELLKTGGKQEEVLTVMCQRIWET